MVEQDRIDWNLKAFEPALRVGIGRSSMGAAVTVLAEELRLAESGLS